MGCCPSKSRAQYDAACTELVAASRDAQATTPTAATTVVVDSSSSSRAGTSTSPSSNQQRDATPATLLMDRGDGTQLLKSDGDPTPSSPPSALEPSHAFCDSSSDSAAGPNESSSNNSAATAIVSESSSSSADDAKRSSTIDATGAIRAAEPTASVASETPSPLVLQSSPRKAPVNFDDVPITSMYHRIHVVEAEALDARRQAELQAEAARRELEVREFKAAMQQAP